MTSLFGWLRVLVLVVVLHWLAFWRSVASYFLGSAARKLGLVKPPSTKPLRTPDDRFDNLPGFSDEFKPHYMDDGPRGCRVHYLDEGPKDAPHTFLCLHGEPTWCYLYRKMIPGLVAAPARVIAPDFIGFGRSDKLSQLSDYDHELHVATIARLLDHLDLHTNITLVCQDWGGITGLTLMSRYASRFSSVVIMNTGLPPHGRVSLRTKFNFLTWLGFVKLFRKDLPVGKVVAASLHSPDKRAQALAEAAYSAPFPDRSYRAGVAKWPLLVPLHSDAQVAPATLEASRFLEHEWKGSTLVMFSDKCPVTRGLQEYFCHLIPSAKRIDVTGGGHFLQEDLGESLAEKIVAFVNDDN